VSTDEPFIRPVADAETYARLMVHHLLMTTVEASVADGTMSSYDAAVFLASPAAEMIIAAHTARFAAMSRELGAKTARLNAWLETQDPEVVNAMTPEEMEAIMREFGFNPD
jgi:hypothetical protein